MIASQAGNYTHNEKNIRIRLDDTEWCKAFLKNMKREFAKNKIEYPLITRHGWNIPPADLNMFYLKEMNVLADASAVKPSKNIYSPPNKMAKRTIEWRDTALPYYTNINDDLNSVWDGKEETRGLLEIPLTFHDISAFGFSDENMKLLNELPSGTLISTYIHPHESIKKLDPLLSYLKSNYKVKFISAFEYLEIYMRHFPRPLIVDLDTQKSYWAYLDDAGLNKICGTKAVNLLTLDKKFLIDVKTNIPIPMLGFISERISRLKFDGRKLVGKKRANKYYYEIGEVTGVKHTIQFE
jgi:hypothetical protein